MTEDQYQALLGQNRLQIAEPREDRTLGISPLPMPRAEAPAAQEPRTPQPSKAETPVPANDDPGEPADTW
jgi:hypothetical protein